MTGSVKISHAPKKYKYDYSAECRCQYCKSLCSDTESLKVHMHFCDARIARHDSRIQYGESNEEE